MSRKKLEKIAGVYLIRIKPTGRVYIGSSNNIRRRIKLHRLAAMSSAPTVRRSGELYDDIRKYGVKSMEIEYLDVSEDMKDEVKRLNMEYAMIVEYNAKNPQYGYNIGGIFGGPTQPRKQMPIEKINRAKSVVMYDTQTGGAWLFFSGAKEVGKHLGYTKEKQYGKDVMSHAVKDLSLIRSRYLLFYVDKDMRKDQLKRATKHAKTDAKIKYIQTMESIVSKILELDFHYKQ